MAKTYQWSTKTNFASDTDLDYGVIPNDPSWHTETAGNGSATASYYYRDANQPPYTDANSSRVITSVSNTWTASISDLNVLTINLHTTINSIARDDVVGTNPATPGRYITVKNSGGTTVFGPYTDSDISYAHSISGEVSVGDTTIVIQPGASAEHSALQLHNQTIGGSSYDDIGIGVRFKNTLPTPTTYTLNYDANGGTGAPSAQSHTTGESSYTFTVSSTKPTWGLYKFLGWSNSPVSGSGTSADVDYEAGDTITLTSSGATKTIYAVWMKDYRPGASLNTTTSVWRSHNRVNGACHVLSNTTNITWQECRTIGGAEGEKGNPPLILTAANANSWRNQKRLGKES